VRVRVKIRTRVRVRSATASYEELSLRFGARVDAIDPLVRVARRRAGVTVGTRLFCQRPELFPKDTTRPLYAKPQSEHSLTRDTQWVGGSHKRHRTAIA